MKKLYKGNIRSLSITKLEFDGANIKDIKFNKAIIKKDALFYKNFFNVMISFDIDTKLPDFDEAYDCVFQVVSKHPELMNEVACQYTDFDEFKYFANVSGKEFRELKKSYKEKRKIKLL